MRKIFINTAIFILAAIFTIPAFAQEKLTGEWELAIMVKDGAVYDLGKDAKRPTLRFGDSDGKGRLSGNASCNTYGGDYTLTGGKITVGSVFSTKMGCAPAINKQESTYLDILGKATLYKSDEGILHLSDAGSKNRLTFKLKAGHSTGGIKPMPEVMNHLWIVNKTKVDCQGAAPQKCLQVKKTDAEEWANFSGTIAGFKYNPGKYYLIRVTATKKKNVPADASAYDYKLIKVMSRTKLMPHVD